MRSIPEKTLEHWCSIHLSYRYRAKMRMWWPTAGEDIDVSGGPLAPGKRFWLELKTTEWNKTAKRHDLSIDLDQLAAYGRDPVPDFYVFPVPRWEGILGKSPKPLWASGLDPSDFAYESHSYDKWFPHWLYVVPGSVLRRIVGALPSKSAAKPPSASKKKSAKKKKNVLRVAEVTGGKLTWLIPAPKPDEVLLWRNFWRKMETCGDGTSFAAQFILPLGTPGLPSPPAPASPGSNGTPPSGLPPTPGPATTTWEALKSAAATLKEKNEKTESISYDLDSLLLWSPTDGTFLASTSSGTSRSDGFVWGKDTGRSLVLLSVDALLTPKKK